MPTDYKWLPVVSDYCTGCGKCVEICPHECLGLVWEFATLQRAEDCVSEGDCVEVCPHEGIRMEWVETTGNQDIGRWSDTLEAVPSAQTGWLRCLFQKRSTAVE
jgi:NAD-dependent dihydropyrimidine dehydrogenase PreA subunit